MKVGIVDYKAGNVTSVTYALKRLGAHVILTNETAELNGCDKIIFPGVGHAQHAMQQLQSTQLHQWIGSCQQPLLGICLGMQLLCTHSDEGNTSCIGIFETPVRKFEAGVLKVPQMGWNTLDNMKGPLFKGLPKNPYVYFVHSYYVPLNTYTVASCGYGIDFSAALQKENFFAVQFHPEKSGAHGELILRNFLDL